MIVLYPPLILENGGDLAFSPVVIMDVYALTLNQYPKGRICLVPEHSDAFNEGCVDFDVPKDKRIIAVALPIDITLNKEKYPDGDVAYLQIYGVKSDGSTVALASFETYVAPLENEADIYTGTEDVDVYMVFASYNKVHVFEGGDIVERVIIGPLYILHAGPNSFLPFPIPKFSSSDTRGIICEILVVDRNSGRIKRAYIGYIDEVIKKMKYISFITDITDTQLRVVKYSIKVEPNAVNEVFSSFTRLGYVEKVEQTQDGKYEIVLRTVHGIAQFGIGILIAIIIGMIVTGVCVFQYFKTQEVKYETEKVKILSDLYTKMGEQIVEYASNILKSNLPPEDKVKLLTNTNPILTALQEVTKSRQQSSAWQNIQKIIEWVIIGAVIILFLKFMLSR